MEMATATMVVVTMKGGSLMSITEKEIAEYNAKLASGMTLKEIAEQRGDDPQAFYQRLRIAGLVVQNNKQIVWRKDVVSKDAAA
jgi:DNA-binding CsgD family transcriptional regulator